MIQKIKNIYHLLQAVVANLWYAFPSREIKVIGVTGTDGKTTTTHLLYHILNSSGKHVSMLSTIYAKVAGKEYDTGFHVTTPDPFLVQKLLRSAVENGDEYFVLETTSHSIDQNRVWGVQFDSAVLTNITHEHLDYHKSIKEYAKTKWRLVEMARIALVNADDEVTHKMVENQKRKATNLKTYGLAKGADYSQDFRKEIPDLADFNAYNYLGAYGLCKELGITDKSIVDALKTYKLPAGRIDIVYKKKFMVIVDFAHTPNGIYRILETVKKQYVHGEGRLIHVFGSAGLRDHTKRSAMGAASATFADASYITEEDYRTEDPHKIADEIGAGFKNKKYIVEVDREKAIHSAIDNAKPGDVVVITGKGHEKSLCRGKIEYPWSDIDCVKSYVSTLS
jgi:UDP-N-acetylmuramoyl-L-alanyl-D-glutamate--2,6-diaminopimelate ligase